MNFPIDHVLPKIGETLNCFGCAVLVAEPGAGKTTQVPLALLHAPWLGENKILMLEPRRIAARSAVEFMARRIGEEPGELIGYRTRGDTRVSKKTKIEVVTEGILTRILQESPDLEGYGVVLFDEFHERSLQGDLGLALTIQSRRILREDLRILVMSATLESERVGELLGSAPIITCPGRTFPLEFEYISTTTRQGEDWSNTVTQTVRRALREHPTSSPYGGDLLVFLPGRGEIERVRGKFEALTLPECIVTPLYSEIDKGGERLALTPHPTKRKIILATSVAETSVTISGVSIVIDSGLSRVSRFNPRRGMSGLETVPVSPATATQRAGRAGREAPGFCYRLWSETEHQALQKFSQPEIATSDLSSFLLELGVWGETDVTKLPLLDFPPQAHLSQARDLLIALQAFDSEGRVTSRGRDYARLGIHPRLSRMLIESAGTPYLHIAADVAALIEERDVLTGREKECDLFRRWHLLNDYQSLPDGKRKSSPLLARITRQGERLARLVLGEKSNRKKFVSAPPLGEIVALAFPDRVAMQRSPNSRSYLLQSGGGAELPPWSMMNTHPFLVVIELDAREQNSRIFLAEPIEREEILKLFSSELSIERELTVDEATLAARVCEVTKLGALRIKEQNVPIKKEESGEVLLRVLQDKGITFLSKNDSFQRVTARLEWLQSVAPLPNFPDFSDMGVMESLSEWLGPYLQGRTSLRELLHLPLGEYLEARLTWDERQHAEREAPRTYLLPSGNTVQIDYSGPAPSISCKLQELFGEAETPHIGRGKHPLTLYLLSPAGRPLQVTKDLKSFWLSSYNEVRKEMKGRYPKHPWPEEPLSAQPTRKTKRALG